MQVGAVINYLHDISDIFVCILKVLTGVTIMNKIITNFLTALAAVWLLGSWFWTRLFCLPRLIFGIVADTAQPGDYYFLRCYSAAFSGILIVLHVYWYILIAKVRSIHASLSS